MEDELMTGNEQISLKRGDKIRTVNGISGEVDCFQVTGIFGSRFIMRRIRGVDTGPNSITMTVWPGTYGRQEPKTSDCQPGPS